MALFTYSVKYRFVCENCGKQTDWLSYSITQDAGNLKSVAEELKIWAKDVAISTNSINVVDTMRAVMNTDHADEVPIEIYTKDNQRIKNAHDKFHQAIEKGDLSILKAVCPECRQRQSWAPKKSLFKKNTKLVKNVADVVEIDWNSEKVDIHK